MKHVLLFIVVILAGTIGYSQEAERRFIYFDYNDFQLTPEAKRELDQILAKTTACTVNKVELYGHTDSDGDPASNHILAQNRVASVKSFLVSKGVDPSLIVHESFGEQQPSYTNESEAGRRKNRRVEVVFSYTCAPIITEEPLHHPIQVIDRDTFLTIPPQMDNPQPVVDGDTQRFICKGDKEIFITGKQGTEITMYKNSFIDAKGKTVAGEIEIQLIEVYKKSDMVLYGLGTTSNGKLLESGGMIYFNATSNGEPVFLNPKTWDYEIAFPASDKKDDMGIFYADSVAGPSNWIPAVRNFSGDNTYLKNRETLDKYVFNSEEMGWINCDRFIGKEKLTDVYVDMADTAGVSFALVFKDINSAMASGGGNRPVGFYNVPIGYEVTLIAFRKTGETYSYFSKDFTVEKNHREAVTLVNLTEEEFQKRLKELD